MYLPPNLRNVQKCPMYLKRKYRGSCDPEAWWKWRLESSSCNSVRKKKKLYRKVGVYYFFEKRVAGGVPCPALPPHSQPGGRSGSKLRRELASVGKIFKKGKSIPSEKCQSRQKNQLFILFVQWLICLQIGVTRCIWRLRRHMWPESINVSKFHVSNPLHWYCLPLHHCTLMMP